MAFQVAISQTYTLGTYEHPLTIVKLETHEYGMRPMFLRHFLNTRATGVTEQVVVQSAALFNHLKECWPRFRHRQTLSSMTV